ncbi:MAG TPA: hypothetical protein VFB19_18595 [Mycobacterium sp.]|nr:hypothetical protein [Mycobacterium sp.]
MPGEWTHNGTAQGLRDFGVRLVETGQVGLRRDMTKAISLATKPARKAVKDKLREEMPKSGGANKYLARRIPVRTAVTFGSRSAGVRVRSNKRGSDLRRLDSGTLMHPVFGNRKAWTATQVPAGWFEDALRPFGPLVESALAVQMHETAIKAGFK